MTNEEFTNLVKRAEALAERDPSGYRFRVAALGALGYLYVWALVLLSIVLALAMLALISVSAAAIKIALPLFAFAGVLLKSLWVKFTPPSGVPLEEGEFGKLHDMLEEIRVAVNGPRLHQVLLDDQFNASITQVPRLGVLGFHKNYLVLGLPLMLALSKEELEAVLAHEYGHLSGSHGKFGAWIYRIRVMWMRLLHAFQEEKGLGSGMVSKFFGWYAPYFQAYSFALARANEYDADRAAASFAGKEPAGSALVRISTIAPHLEQAFWPDHYRRADESPVPDGAPFHAMAGNAFLPTDERSRELLSEALNVETDLADTHPSLRDRLASLGTEGAVPTPLDINSAQVYLGGRFHDFIGRFDERWRVHVTPWFEGRFQFVEGLRNRLAEVRAQEGAEEGDISRLVEEARIIDELQGREASLPLFEKVLRVDPGEPYAKCVVAFERLRAGDDAAVDMMEAAMASVPGFTLEGCQALRDYFASRDDMASANKYHERLITEVQRRDAIERERSSVPMAKVYLPPTLEPAAVEVIREAIRSTSSIGKAYLVRKRLELSEEPCHLLVLKLKRLHFVSGSRNILQEVAEAIRIPDQVLVVLLNDKNGRLLRFVRKVEGAELRF